MSLDNADISNALDSIKNREVVSNFQKVKAEVNAQSN